MVAVAGVEECVVVPVLSVRLPRDGKCTSFGAFAAFGGLLVSTGEAPAPGPRLPVPPEELLLKDTPGDGAPSGGDSGPAGEPDREARPGLPVGDFLSSCPKL